VLWQQHYFILFWDIFCWGSSPSPPHHSQSHLR
jgi:hypothetical protein